MTITHFLSYCFLNRTRYPVIILLAAVALLHGCSDSNELQGRESKPQPVITEAVHWQQRFTVVEAVGTSRARQSATLYPEVSDVVTAISFKAGERVGEGQRLLQLEDRDERLAVKLAEVQVADADRLYQRYLKSQGAGAVTESTLDISKSDLDQARIRLERAQVAVQQHVIVAPFAGVVGLTDIDPGARVNTTTAITTIDDRSSLLVTFEVPEVFHGQLREGQEVSLGAWSANGPQFKGLISAIDSQIDVEARTFVVRATVDNQDDQLRPGMSFKVRLDLSDGQYPAVPEIALQWGGDGAFVWTLRDGKATRVSATVVQRIKGEVLIDAELADGARVITEGTHLVREGQAIEVVNPGQAPASGQAPESERAPEVAE